MRREREGTEGRGLCESSAGGVGVQPRTTPVVVKREPHGAHVKIPQRRRRRSPRQPCVHPTEGGGGEGGRGLG